jgi:glycerol-3-phosphate acyltransferase PlsY
VIKTYIIVALVSYLLGSIPFGYILVRLFLKKDIRATGSGNIGATNVARSGAKGLAIATLVLDAAKGLLAVIIACAAFAFEFVYDQRFALSMAAFAGFCAVIGHMFPVWLRFRGGKGVATAVGAFFLLSPSALGIALVVFIVIVGVTRFVSLGSIVASLVFAISAYYFPSGDLARAISPQFFFWLSLTSMLIVLKHHENIRRLLAGTENKFGAKKSVPPPEAMEKRA